ncbi:MAG: amino acid adenylation domain-containing protein [Halanaerobiales bacterium]|nr:amino acid adenylation domain-containing protein [Halanaerobiales bacterium]
MKKVLQNLIYESVDHYPDHIAIEYGQKSLTYRELDNYSNIIANFILSKGLKKEAMIGILVEDRSVQIFLMLGILKAGCIFVPFDPAYPLKRTELMVSQVDLDLFFADTKYSEIFNGLDICDPTEMLKDISSNSSLSKRPDIEYQMDQKMYIYFTSGSTGTPKGILGSCKGLLQFVMWEIDTFNVTPRFRITQLASPAFDASLKNIFVPLCAGGTICIPENREIILDVTKFIQWIDDSKVNMLQCVPSLFRLLVSGNLTNNHFKELKYILLAGEKLSPKNFVKWYEIFDERVQIVNLYGPTETTLVKTFYLIQKSDTAKSTIPIGKPMRGARIIILDENMNICEEGQSGEIYIRTPYMTLGYFNDPELTKEKFIQNPFNDNLKDLIYKTGDLGRWMFDGNLEFIGRKDFQVKIRGVRIELGDIENHLLDYSGIKETVVIDKEDVEGEKYLCAYFVADQEIPAADLRNHLSLHLPEYMIPAYFIRVEKLPLTPNGKIDRKALPEPDNNLLIEVEYIAPRNEVESKLAKIWSEILRLEKVGVTANFFTIGGHSLKATAVVSEVFKEFNVELPLREIFKTPTIEDLAKYISGAEKSIYNSIIDVQKGDYADGYYPLSSAQKRLYLLNQLEGMKTGYNITGVYQIQGLDRDKFEDVVKTLVKKHETFRTSFEMKDGELVQRIHDDLEFEIKYITLKNEERFDEILKEFIRPFDLSKAPLFRVGLIDDGDQEFLVFDMHHIISDGTSMGILIDDFVSLYNGIELTDLRIQYKDFAIWQNDLCNSEIFKEQEEYWVERFSQDDEYPVLNMPTDYPRPSIMSFEGNTISFRFDKELTDQLIKLANKNGATLYMVLLASYNILLSKYTGQEDIIVGSPIAGRPHADLKNIIGMFVNTLAMRNMPEGGISFTEFLARVKENALTAYENQDYQFEMLVDKLDLRRDLSRNPLFDAMFVLQNMSLQPSAQMIDDLRFTPYGIEKNISKFDLTLNTWESNEEIYCNLQYCTKLFKKETMERFIGHFRNIVTQIVENSDRKLMEITMISESEKEELIYKLNDTKTDYPRDKTIPQIFEEQVKNNPDKIALIFEDQRMTYLELNERSNQLGRTLITKGVKADKIVGLMVERSFEMIIGILGILKAGGAYLPIDPENPVARIEYILKDSETDIIVAEPSLTEKIQFAGDVINIADENIYTQSFANLEIEIDSSNLAYVIYTSGTIGKPKGNLTSHYNIVRVVKDTNYIEINHEDRLLQLSNYAFDGSTFDIYGALLNGAKLVLVPKEILLDVCNLAKLIKEQEISVTFITTALFNMLVDTNIKCFEKVRKILFGGERVSVSHVQKALNYLGTDRLIHVYGPTESTVFATHYFINEVKEHVETIPIGLPIANTQVYILDKDNQLCPIGVVGELCISGDGLAKGYLNRPNLTDEKFISNMLVENAARIYRTGDLAKRLADGNIEFIGRIDTQVKIRGFRIELGEIEKRLLDHNLISEAVVIDLTDSTGSKYLAAYVVIDSECETEISLEIRSFLSKELPEYMIPLYLIQLDKLPLNRNGKVDRQALPEPDISVKAKEYVAPTNEIEERLAMIWSEILGIQQVGITDNFFELGGHSLKATVMVSRIFKEFNVDLPIREVFKTPTIKELAQYISNADENICASIKKVEECEYYPLSSAQKRMYLLNQFEEMKTGYNMPSVMKVEGDLDKVHFEKVIKELIRRHDAFRTSFEMIAGEVVQRIHADVNFKIAYINIDDKKTEEQIFKDFIRPFDLSQAPLLRVGLIESDDKALLIFDMHHIISDGMSMQILTGEFVKLYTGIELPELRIQYKDFAFWQNDLFNSEIFDQQEKYWLTRFGEDIPVLNMPTDYPRPAIMSFAGNTIPFAFEKEITDELNKLATENGATLYMVLLASYNILLSKYSNQEDIIVGSPIAGRLHADLTNIIGMFVNTLAMRNIPSGHLTFREFLNNLKENALAAYENQDYQFEMLVDKLDLRRNMSRNPLFDTMFVLQNAEMNLQLEPTDQVETNLRFLTFGFENKISKFDLTLNAWESNENIRCNLQYCTRLFKKEMMERLIEHFQNIITQIIENPDRKLMEITMITDTEKEELIYKLNDTKTEYPKQKTIQQIFEEQVEKSTDNVALKYRDQEMTYLELNNKSNQLARVLREKGVGPDKIVGLMVERSFEMIIGILGILKAGGAYLPIDLENPVARIVFILKDSGTDLLVIHSNLSTLIEDIQFDGEVIDIKDKAISQSTANIETEAKSFNLAYVIYTSGTTGKPKGNLTSHHNIVRVVKDTNYIEITDEDNLLQLSNYAFDGSTFDIYGALLNGAQLVMVPKETLLDVSELSELIREEEITVTFITTALFNMLVDTNIECFEGIRKILFGGERVSVQHVQKALEYLGKDRLIHVYGPTESTVFATYYFINEAQENVETIPIGLPIANTQVYILDKDDQLCPIGVVGELCISGDGLARGYLNRSELTNEKFIPNMLTDNSDIAGDRIYRTGDLANRLADGNIEFVGRIDMQVKIRGFRIELGEIEKRLLDHEEISETVVIDLTDSTGSKYLVAYYVVESECACASEESLDLRIYLSRELPEYMIPLHFIKLDKLPLNRNGKVDLLTLPEPDISRIAKEYVAPTNEIEERLAMIWSEILGIKKIGITDNFFELGGHSLKATSMVSSVFKEFNVQLPIREVFKTPTIDKLALYILNADENIYRSIKIVDDIERIHYPLSSAQRRLYVLNQLEGMKTGYNMPSVLRVEGDLDRERFENIIKKLITRHDAFRTSFEVIDGEVVQKIYEDVDFAITYLDLEGRKSEVERTIKEFVKPFDLSQAPLLRVGLIESDDETILIFDMHHIISDGVSMEILINEFLKLYAGTELSELRVQYKDFALWQNDLFNAEKILKQEEYWLGRFNEGTISVLNMPTDYARPLIMSFEGANFSFEIDQEITNKLYKIANQYGATLYMVLLTAFNVLLARYTGQEDIIVGSPIAGRPHPDLGNIIGMFVNTLAMWNRAEGEMEFGEFLARVKENALMAYENQDYQFEMLVQKLDLRRDMSRNPLFDVMFVLQTNQYSSEDIKADLRFTPYRFENKVSKFDITLNARENNGRITCNFEYCTRLFKKETMARLASHFGNLVSQIAMHPDKKLMEFEMIAVKEREQLLYEFNDTKHEYAEDKTIHQLFEEQVDMNPHKVAVVYKEKKLTYHELNHKTNQLARFFINRGIEKDQIVGIMMERSIEMFIGMLAVLKAGGAYLPIDPNYPDARIEYMLQDSDSKMLLSISQCLKDIDYFGEVITIEDLDLATYDENNPKIKTTPNNLAYVIYTSGSTGKPKGVMIEHLGISNMKTYLNRDIGVNESDKIIQFASCSFDASVWETYMALLSGATLYIVPEDVINDYKEFERFINDNAITMMLLPPIYLSNFTGENLPTLKRVLTGGSATNYELVNRWKDIDYINAYGPTEATICVTTWKAPKGDLEEKTIPIGKPIYNTKIYILDKYQKLAPIGVLGEICIAGVGIARGYLNRPELTAEKFIPNPFDSSQKIYKTGDMGRWLPDGNIEFLGRIDNQVKIRGYRIELGEIEHQLLEHEAIKEVTVIDRIDSTQSKYLVAFIVASDDLSSAELRTYLANKLPEYMIPSYFVTLDQLPLTSSGKVDYHALPVVEEGLRSKAEYLPPTSRIEEILVEIWKEVLGVEQVGIRDNFFDLGGDSIKAIQISARLQKYNMKVDTKDLFQNLTIEELADQVKVKKNKAEQGLVTGEVELTPIQKWFFAEDYTDMHHYNQAVMLYNQKGFDEEIVKKVFDKIIEHHDNLRSVFRKDGDKFLQEIRDISEELYTFKRVDFLDEKLESNEIAHKVKDQANKIQSSIDFTEGPLVNLGLFKTNNGDHLLIVIHHLVVDGVSWRILFEDFRTAYQQVMNGFEIKLQEKTDSFKEWSKEIQKYSDSPELLPHIEYWRKIEESIIQPIQKDFESKKNDLSCNQNITMNLSLEETELLLKDVNQAYGTEINDILLTALALAYEKWTGKNKVAFVLEGHGREEIIEDIDITRTIGWFTSTYPVILEVKESEDLAYQIKLCKETFRQIPDKGIGYGLLKHLSASVGIDFKLKPEISFNYLGQFDQDISSDSEVFSISPFSSGEPLSKKIRRNFAIEISGMIALSKLNLTFSYNKLEFKQETISKFADFYKESLINIIDHCKQQTEQELTPSDVGDQELTLEEFDFISDFVEDLDLDLDLDIDEEDIV